ncbi:uncharacterized protein UV8b_03699 [Ustilaginoidea virens]|uniref:SANT domain-containing protein n=1 Tax=Ustilaginoidea virens TaxID=1159556 RepID=A0A063BZS5_USTVR|nr:uncharacterized protein UV8b_03699 [Ustilaginoidea virens]QUC19458.1 hypothetical protein UV8b_03699 [Ustilaginoidea virens]GAO13281.1 hypothetical protein UVI_02026260 [Ustilaginoidea virens]
MSSMFKKKGGLAFKPKAPVARPKPPAPSTKPAPAPEQPAIDANSEPATEDVPQVAHAESESRQVGQGGLGIPVEETREQQQWETSTAPGQTARPTLHGRQEDSVSRPQKQPETLPRQAETSEEETAGLEPVADSSAGIDIQPSPTPRNRTVKVHHQPAVDPLPPQPSIEPHDQAPSSSEQTARPEPPVAENEGQRSSTAAAAEAAETAGDEPDTPAAPGPGSKRAPRKQAATTQDATVSDPAEGEPARPRKRQRKTRPQGQDSQTPAPRKRKTSTPKAANGSRSSSRRARSLTPEDAETQVVDLQKLKMSDLTKDLRIGKKFSRHDELRDRERKARQKAKLDKDTDTPPSEAGDGTSQSRTPDAAATTAKPNAPGAASAPASAPASASASAPAAASGPQFRIVDGQIVVDQDSLVMDRHARAAAARAGEHMETVEENDFTCLITSSSFMNTSKLKGPNIWTDQETELFYRGLRMFGTEFEMISKMFPGKRRRHVKLKFNREERHNPSRIDAALIGEKTIKMDIDEYRAFTGAEFESLEVIEAEQRKIQETYEAERQRVADEQAEVMRKKRDELFADEDGEGDLKRKKKNGKRKGKQSVSYGLNGEPILQDGG